jgi:hypothetical protein
MQAYEWHGYAKCLALQSCAPRGAMVWGRSDTVPNITRIGHFDAITMKCNYLRPVARSGMEQSWCWGKERLENVARFVAY